jgi:hypothetical protein
VWAVSLVFFLAHLPNPVLLITVAIAGPLLGDLSCQSTFTCCSANRNRARWRMR